MFTVKTGFATASRRFLPGMTVHPHDCNSQAHFERLVELGHIVDDTPVQHETKVEPHPAEPAPHADPAHAEAAVVLPLVAEHPSGSAVEHGETTEAQRTALAALHAANVAAADKHKA